jgi:hypothetical protein
MKPAQGEVENLALRDISASPSATSVGEDPQATGAHTGEVG